MIDTKGKYYLGRAWDPETGETGDDNVLYDPEDLTTHAVVVGMTGSGKTGLCIDLMEEAALNNVPALIVDPKGDLTNLLLHFPELLPADFEPWINATEAKRDGKTAEEAAAETADLWRNGLAGWDIEPDRLQALKDSVRFTIYTPGSTAGVPVSVLASLEAPGVNWEGNEEVLREQISSTVTALLGLVGLHDIDPVQSREHILMSNIFAEAWQQGRDLNLSELIMQIQSPPFSKLGVFDVNTFYPEKDRFGLAMRLNSMLASPSFQTWIEGQPLDIAGLLYDAEGSPRHSVFYIAHLNDEERMFFVTLLYSSIEAWMRAQKGTSSLRALVYFDEIHGYIPPVANPPSKTVMLRMLKQARAFGVGMVLATQNPVDVDYKGLSNAGTWFIGKLGTEQDKERLLDGLSSVAAGALDRKTYDRLISAIGKRVFLMRNVHDKQPSLFQTRWAMNYLAGPLTRAQIPSLNELAGAANTPVKPVAVPEAAPVATAAATRPPAAGLPGTETRPAIPRGVGEYTLPLNLSLSEAAAAFNESLPAGTDMLGIVYRPVLLAQADISFSNARYGLDTVAQTVALVQGPETSGIDWGQFAVPPMDAAELNRPGKDGARYTTLEQPLADEKQMKALEAEFKDWVYHNYRLPLKENKTLKLYAGPDVTEEEFAELCAEAADDRMDEELDKMRERYASRIESVQTKLEREQRELEQDTTEFEARRGEEWLKHAETLFGMLGKRRRSLSSSLTKRRMTATAKADIEESEQAIAQFSKDLEALKQELEEELDEIEEKWAAVAEDVSETPLKPAKSHIRTSIFGVGWLPTYQVEANGRTVEYPGYAPQA